MVRARRASRAATLMVWVRMVAARAAGLTRMVKAHHDHDALGSVLGLPVSRLRQPVAGREEIYLGASAEQASRRIQARKVTDQIERQDRPRVDHPQPWLGDAPVGRPLLAQGPNHRMVIDGNVGARPTSPRVGLPGLGLSSALLKPTIGPATAPWICRMVTCLIQRFRRTFSTSQPMREAASRRRA
jgi:hypothetical protein